jgi:predicted ATPase
MIHLRAIAKKPNVKKSDSFPFNLPLVKAFEEINFQKPVTFFVGENGSGKSTMLEAIAAIFLKTFVVSA